MVPPARIRFVLLLGALAAAIGVATPPAGARELHAGFAVHDITPARPVPLAGYSGRMGKRSEGVHDPIRARVLALDNGETRMAIVALDMIGVDRRCREALVRALARKIDLRPEHLLVCATHTHNGPGALARDLHWWIATGPYDDRLFRDIVARTAAAIEAAFANLQPARLGVAQDDLPGFNRNRRVDNGPVSSAFTLIRVDRADGTPMGVVVNYAAHPTILSEKEMLLSADFPGALCAELERRHGAGFTALFTNGDEGDMGPSTPGGSTRWERVEAMGKALADEVDRRMPGIPTNTRVLLRGQTATLRLPSPRVPVVFPESVVLQSFQIQDLVLLAVPGEMCADVGRRVRDAVRGRGQSFTAIVGLANDHLGYFTSPEGFERGGYEADMNFYGKGIGRAFEEGFSSLVTVEDPWGM